MRSDSRTVAIHALWDELADFPAAQSDAALMFLMQTLCRLLGADNAFWIGTVRMANGAAAQRDPQHGWRIRVASHLRPSLASDQRVRRGMREQDTDPPATTCALTAKAGTFRVHRLRDGHVDFAAFRRTEHYRAYYETPGIADRMCVAYPVNADSESWMAFDHMRSRRRFSAADASLAGEALRRLKWFHRQVLLSYGLPLAREPLSPAQRRVLLLLLAGHTKKGIGAQLRITPGSAHQYAVEVYRKMNVKGRAELTALWLSA